MRKVAEFILLFLVIGSALAQPNLAQLASLRSKQFEQERLRLLSQQPTDFSDLQFARYSPLGVPLFLAPLNLFSARATRAANLTEAQNGIRLQGEGMQIAAWDDGLVAPHAELDTRVIANEGVVLKTHATHVAGTLVASGINANARGMAPKAQLTAFLFDNDEAEMAALAGSKNSELLISNHSYGTITGWTGWGGVWRWAGNPAVSEAEDYNFGLYTAKAQLLDEIASQAPYYTICWAAGNDRVEVGNGNYPPDCNGGTGYDCIIPDAVAKNIITVGAIDQLPDYTSPASMIMSSYSSWGPTDDGRIKPDLVGVGTGVFSLQATPANTYTFLSGTSMATPNVAGSLLLLQELHQKLHGGNSMRAATLKALAIHHAREAGPFPGPDYSFGWGLLDVGASAQTLLQADGRQIIVRELTLTGGSSFTLDLLPAAGRKITATIVWTDPPGKPAPDRLDPSELALVHDLDMRLVDDQGNTHLPWTLNPANPAERAARGDNFRDNVEKIELENPVARPYQLRITHKSTLRQGSQPFSLIVTYTHTQAGRTLYWIGDEGSWSDGTRWSFLSGGTPAFTVPGAADRVIVDENSFDSSGSNEITLPGPVNVRSLLWIDSQPSALNLNGATVTINQEMKIATSRFTARGTGVFAFQNSTAVNAVADFFDFTAPGVTLEFMSGDWRVGGKLHVAAISRKGGNLSFFRSRILAGRLEITGTTPAILKLSESEITLRNSWVITGSFLTIQNDQSALSFKGNTLLDANDRVISVPIRLDSGRLTITGNNNQLVNLRVAGRLAVVGSQQVDRLTLAALAEVAVQANSRLRVADIDAAANTRWTGMNNSWIESIRYKKICLPRTQVSGLPFTGKGVITIGPDGIATNSPGWQTAACEALLFADFMVSYPCQGANTIFTDRSGGAPAQFTWEVKQGTRQETRNGVSAAMRFVESGPASVRLRIEKNGAVHERDSTLFIGPNSMPPNPILPTTDRLMSFLEAERYQWYRNEVLIPGATARMYTHNGEPGAYLVLAFRESCNRWSDVFVITGAEESEDPDIRLVPNPADHDLQVFASQTVLQITLRDLAGRLVCTHMADRADLSQIPAGLYVCEVQTAGGRSRHKLVVRH